MNIYMLMLIDTIQYIEKMIVFTRFQALFFSAPKAEKTQQRYSRTSLSRTRLFRITAYLEVKLWSLF